MRSFLKSISYFFIFIIAGQLSLQFISTEPLFIPFWLPTGLMFFALVKEGKLQLPGIALASFCNTYFAAENILSPSSNLQIIIPCFFAAIFTCLQLFVLNQLFEKILSRQLLNTTSPTPFNLKITFKLALPVSLITPSFGIACFALTKLISAEHILQAWVTWYWAELGGLILMIPLIASYAQRPTAKKEHLTLFASSLILLIIYLSLITTQFTKQREMSTQKLSTQIEDIHHTFDLSLQTITQHTQFIANVSSTTEGTNTSSFDNFASTLLEKNPFIKNILLIKELPKTERSLHSKSFQQKYGAEYQLHEITENYEFTPAASREIHYPIISLNPNDANLIGYDLASSPNASTALGFAKSTQKPFSTHINNHHLTEIDQHQSILFSKVPNQNLFVGLIIDGNAIANHLLSNHASGMVEFSIYKYNGIDYEKSFDSLHLQNPHLNQTRIFSSIPNKHTYPLSFGQQMWYMHFQVTDPLQIGPSSDLCILQAIGVLCLLLINCLISESSVHNDRTSQLLVQRNRQLKRTEKRLTDTSRSKNDFISNLSYHMRTPMTTIVGYADLLKNPEIDSKDLHKYSQIIHDQSTQLLSSIDDTLELIKIEDQSLTLHLSDFSPLKLAKKISIQYKDQVILASHYPMVHTINSDQDRIFRILSTLCNTALKDSNKTLTLDINYTESAGTHFINFDIFEPEKPMPSESLSSIKDAFSKNNSNIAKQVDIAGLDLTLCHHLARLLNGRLIFLDELPSGSAMRLQLRLHNKKPNFIYQDPSEAKLTHPKEAETENKLEAHKFDDTYTTNSSMPKLEAAPGRTTPSILLVEDNKNNSRLISLMIKKLGYDVHCCYNGKQGLEAVTVKPDAWDLIIMDMKMPIMDGCTAARKIRATNYQRPIVALSSNASPQDKENCLKSGYDDFANKPIVKEKLAELISKHLNKKA